MLCIIHSVFGCTNKIRSIDLMDHINEGLVPELKRLVSRAAR